MTKKNFKFNWQLYLGIVLVVTGGVFLADLFLPIRIMRFFWPLLIVLFGLTFIVGMLVAGRPGSGLAIPGTIVTTIGLLLFVQNTFHLWVTWAYAWALLICATGLGILIMNGYLKRSSLRRVGGLLIGIGLTLFVVFGILFEIILNISGSGLYSGIFLGGGLVLLGLFVVFSRALFKKKSPSGDDHFQNEPVAVDAEFEEAGPMPSPDGAATQSLPESATFTKVNFKSFGEVFLTQGDACELKIDGSEDLVNNVRVDVADDTLNIRFKSDIADWTGLRWMKEDNHLHYFVTMPAIEMVKMAGAGKMECESLKGDSLELIHTGAGKMTLQGLEYQSLEVDLGGLGEIVLTGNVQSQTVDLSGAGSYQAVDLQSQNAQVLLSGAGSAEVWVEKSLKATVTGAGSIKYKGSPTVEQSKTGIGDIKPL
jgi:hypothetical protein